MRIRKFEEFDQYLSNFGDAVERNAGNIEQEMGENPILLDYIEQLAEACYKEGYKDGYRFADWLHERTE